MQTLARAHSMEQIVTSPTRITEKTPSMIDLIFAYNIPRIISSGVFLCQSAIIPLYTAQLKLDFLNLADVIETLIIVATNITMKANLKMM
jgi:hypothetical protein